MGWCPLGGVLWDPHGGHDNGYILTLDSGGGSLGPTFSPIVDVLREPAARAVRGYIYEIYPQRVPTFRRGTWLRRLTPDTEVRVRFPVMALP